MPRPHAPFLSPPPRRYERTADFNVADDKPTWAKAALRTCEDGSSPHCALHTLINLAQSVTNSSERLTGYAAMKLATGGAVPWHMDVEDAVSTLKFVALKESTRAAKRKAEAEAAAALAEAEKEQLGAARKAFKAAVAARPPKTHLQVDNLGRHRVS